MKRRFGVAEKKNGLNTDFRRFFFLRVVVSRWPRLAANKNRLKTHTVRTRGGIFMRPKNV